MAIVLDYSAGRPAAATIARAVIAGQPVVGAERYIGLPGHPKNATAAELADFTAHGLGMGLVFESSGGRWRTGHSGGLADATAARNHATAIGFPQHRPIKMAVDQDVVTEAEFRAMVEYLRGANGPLGGAALTGVYGEYDVMVRAEREGVARWFWQCRAWSGTPVRLFPRRHLFQRAQQTYVGGVLCDINDVPAGVADWGQHNAQEEIDMTTAAELGAKLDQLTGYFVLSNSSPGGETVFDAIWRNRSMLASVLANQADDLDADAVLARVDESVRAATQEALTSTILPAIQRIEEALGRDDADEAKAIVTELAQRLRPAA